MKKSWLVKHVLPHIIAISVFLLIVIVYFSPVFLENKTIVQNDILQWEGSAKELLEHREATGEEGLWTNSMFGGMPAYLISTVYSGDILGVVRDVYSLYLPHPAQLVFTAMVSFYILLLVFGVRPYLAIAGAIAFGLSSFNLISIEAGHNSKVWAIAYMPLVLAGIHMAFTRNRWWGAVLTAFALGLEIRGGHFQITYYLLLIVLIYGINLLIQAIKTRQVAELAKTGLVLILAASLGVAANLGRLWTTYEYGAYSNRGKSDLTLDAKAEDAATNREYAFQWSSGIMESMTLLVPNFYGGASSQALDMDSNLARQMQAQGMNRGQIRQYMQNVPTYWGNQPFTSGPIYAGAVLIFLFVLGIVLVEPRQRNWLIAVVALGLLLSWGKNLSWFNYTLFDYFPGYNKFRSVSMAITIALFGIPLLAMLGLEKFFEFTWNKPLQKRLFLAAGITGGMCLVLIIGAGAFSFSGEGDARLSTQLPAWFMEALQQDRESLLRSDAFRSLILILLSAVILYLYGIKKLGFGLAAAGIIILTTADLWMVDLRYLNSENFQRQPSKQYFAETEADRTIKADPALSYRVYDLRTPLPGSEARTAYHHFSLGGYHGTKMRRFEELVEYHLSDETQQLLSRLREGNRSFEDLPVINMFNVKYFLAGTGKNDVLQNPQAMGNAWLVSKVMPVPNADQEITQLDEVNIRETAVVDTSRFDLNSFNFNDRGTVVLSAYEPNRLVYQANVQDESFVVFSEVYYPKGWTASIDGKRAPILRANYHLRALVVPSGEHTIEFRFAPRSYVLGNKIMQISSIVLLVILIAMGIYEVRQRQKRKELAREDLEED